MSKAFTLMELLIVIAIIAILTAVAVPNFLEAEARTKLSRCTSDMRMLATAIEAYAADRGAYPCAATGFTSFIVTGPSLIDSSLPGYMYVSYRFRRLTTPVAYITSVYQDPYAALQFSGTSGSIPIGNDTYDYLEGTAAYPGSYLDATTPSWRGAGITSGAMWRLASGGPDMIQTWGGSYVGSTVFPGIVDYDPTNGSVSKGDIVRISGLEGPVNWAFPSRWPQIDRIRNQYNVTIP